MREREKSHIKLTVAINLMLCDEYPKHGQQIGFLENVREKHSSMHGMWYTKKNAFYLIDKFVICLPFKLMYVCVFHIFLPGYLCACVLCVCNGWMCLHALWINPENGRTIGGPKCCACVACVHGCYYYIVCCSM